MLRAVWLIALLAPITPHSYVSDQTKYKQASSAMPPMAIQSNSPATSKIRKNFLPLKSDFQLLNHIFDSYAASRKHYHNTFPKPEFSGNITVDDTYLSADTGSTVLFKCQVSSLRDKLVSWLKYTDDDHFEILTLDMDTHTTDLRFRVDLIDDNWQLVLRGARAQDAGVYGCHISTHPPMLLRVNLTIRVPFINMTKEAFLETRETLVLICRVMNLDPGDEPRLRWYRNNSTVPIEELRDSVLVETDQIALTTQLQVARLKMEDAGNYTCALEAPLRLNIVARVHVLQGSSLAELQSGVKSTTIYISLMLASVLILGLNEALS